MSHDDSTPPVGPPNPVGTDDSHDPLRRGLAGSVPLLIGLAVLLVVGVIGWIVIGGDDKRAVGSDCIKDEVRVTTAPAMAGVVKQAVKAVSADEPCIEFKVSEGTVQDVIGLLSDPDAQMPELWLAEGPTWKGELTAAGWSGTPIAQVVAQTPVGLVSGPSATAPASWTEALAGGSVAMDSPSSKGASALALLAPFSESRTTGRSEDEIKAATVPLAQAYGERSTNGEEVSTSLSDVTASSTALIPITEQAYLNARRGNEELTMVVPRTGVPMLQYAIIDVNKGSLNPLAGTRDDRSARAGRALAHWFSSSAGQQAVADAEFRLAGAAKLENGVGIGRAKVLKPVNQKTADAVLRDWRVLSVPSSIISVTDLSGSMKELMAGTSRIDVTSDAASVGINALPDHARVASWGFSKNRGGDGRNWEEFVPFRQLGEDVDGTTQREILQEESVVMPTRVHGATALYDTLAAVYAKALKDWDPAYFNSIVLWTDGASDDSSKIGLDGLLNKIEQMRDPSRPVKVVIIGLSEDSVSPAMNQIAAATGGQFYVVNKPGEMIGVLAQALLAR